MTNLDIVAHMDSTPDDTVVREIAISDLFHALRAGLEDFWANPSHYAFIALLYPIIGIILGVWTSGNNVLPLVYPLVSGFALIGPVAAIGLYEVSRRREMGVSANWQDAFLVLRSPSLPSIVTVGLLLLVIFACWLVAAQMLYQVLLGSVQPSSVRQFAVEVLTTYRGWTMIIPGNLIGLLFAVAALSVSIVTFPLLLERNVGAASAIRTSIRAVYRNPVPSALWGLIVAALLVVGMLPFLVGLVLVMPILGHSTWHLYRRMVEPPRIVQ